MNTFASAGTSVPFAQRVLVLVLTAGAFAVSACGTETASPHAARPAPTAGDTRDWEGSLYPRPFESGSERHRDGESVRAPRAMGGDPTVPPGSMI